MSNLILYAPSVHTGGGFVLLRVLLAAWPIERPLRVLLDCRARALLTLPEGIDVTWVQPKVGSRLHAEITLRMLTRAGDTVLCFHGLPPLIPNRGRVVVFQQNRNYFSEIPLQYFSVRTALRLLIERLVSRLFRHRVSEYIVQTPSMAQTLVRWYCAGDESVTSPTIRVLPFIELPQLVRPGEQGPKEWDFIYVADGVEHKNHRVLLEAWRLLAQDGLRPSLALTLSSRDELLKRKVKEAAHQYGLRIHNLGQMSHDEVLALYGRSGALIFPSISESFGLPLIEAMQVGLPILASELDYVRDVCLPVQTFDAQSPVSIVRAVKRFLGKSDPTLKLHTPTDFWRVVLGDYQL